MIRVLVLLLSVLSLDAWATINAASFQRTILPCGNGDGDRKSEFPSGICTPQVAYTADFESGAILAAGVKGGFALQTTLSTQSGCEYTPVTSGGAATTDTTYDTHVVAGASNSIGADTNVAARGGSYFLFQSLVYSRDYRGINGDPSCTGTTTDKPRNKIYGEYTQTTGAADTERWEGFSIYLPSDMKHETCCTGTDNRKEIEMFNIDFGDNSRQIATLSYFVLDGSTSDFVLKVWTSSKSIDDTGVRKVLEGTPCDPVIEVCQVYYKLGDVVDDEDLGRWTDFVIRWRANPYPSGLTCNPATGDSSGTGTCTLLSSALDHSFTGGNGILQVWKASGTASPNRTMTLVLDITGPVGLVPSSTDVIAHNPKGVYKHGWKKVPTTAFTTDIDIGFDEWRYGAASADSTEYSDVHPGGQAQPP